jgi:hypothetical protein
MLLVVSGHNILVAISRVVCVVNHEAFLTGNFESPDFSQQFGGLAGEHGAQDDFDHALKLISKEMPATPI